MSPGLLPAIAGAVVGVVMSLWLGWVVLTVVLRRAMCGASPRLWRASLRDVLAALEVIGWSLRPRLVPKNAAELGAIRHDGVIVVFLHGTAADGSCMRRWIEAARDAGVDSPMLSLDHGSVLRDVSIHGARVCAALEALLDLSMRAPRLVIVAHSMGGVAARVALASSERVRRAIVGVVTVAAPHHGTGLVRLAPVGPFRSLAWQAPSLAVLPALATLAPRVRSFGSDVDVIVYPDSTADAGGHHEQIVGIGHAALLTDRTVAGRVALAVKALVAEEQAPIEGVT